MSKEKLSMRKVCEVARLKASGLSNRLIAKSCSIARSTVADYLARLASAGLSWPFPPDLGEEQLDVRLSGAQRSGDGIQRAQPRSGH